MKQITKEKCHGRTRRVSFGFLEAFQLLVGGPSYEAAVFLLLAFVRNSYILMINSSLLVKIGFCYLQTESLKQRCIYILACSTKKKKPTKKQIVEYNQGKGKIKISPQKMHTTWNCTTA